MLEKAEKKKAAKALAKELGLTYKDLAKMAQVSHQTVSNALSERTTHCPRWIDMFLSTQGGDNGDTNTQ